MLDMTNQAAQDLSDFLGSDRFATVLADPPWRFTNRTGKVAPEMELQVCNRSVDK